MRRLSRAVLSAAVLALLPAAQAAAQDIPPPGTVSPPLAVPAAAAAAPGGVVWLAPVGGKGVMVGPLNGPEYGVEVTSFGLPGGQAEGDRLVCTAQAGGSYEIQLKVKYKAKEAAKLAGNLMPDAKEYYAKNPNANGDVYNATVHFSSEDRPGYQNVKGEGEVTFTLTGQAPTTAGRYEKSIQVGLFTPKDSPHGMWAPIVVMEYPLALTVAGRAPSTGPLRPLVLYEGDVKSAPNSLYVSSWGGGNAVEVDKYAYYGPKSLQIATQGNYQGVELRFYQPVDVSAYVSRPDAYLEMKVRPYFGKEPPGTPAAAASGTTGAAVTPGKAGSAGATTTRATSGSLSGIRLGGRSRSSGSRPRTTAPTPTPTPQPAATAPTTTAPAGGSLSGIRLGGRSRSSGSRTRTPRTTATAPARPGAPAAATTTATTPAAPKVLIPTFLMERVRVVVETDQGLSECSGYPLSYLTDDRQGWKRFAIPLSMLKGSPLGTKIKSIRIFGEPRDVFYMGQLALTTIDEGITISATATPTTAAVNQVVEFKAALTSYPAPVRVTWDFDSKDGITEEAVGMTASKLYHEAGLFMVTCTANDLLGKKPPAVTTVMVQVQ